jgi:hypothetical protein
VRALNDALPLTRGADEVAVMSIRARAKDLEPGGISLFQHMTLPVLMSH